MATLAKTGEQKDHRRHVRQFSGGMAAALRVGLPSPTGLENCMMRRNGTMCTRPTSTKPIQNRVCLPAEMYKTYIEGQSRSLWKG